MEGNGVKIRWIEGEGIEWKKVGVMGRWGGGGEGVSDEMFL